MSQENELNLKFLENALQQQQNTRRIFNRDLKIVIIFLLVFQFLIFFRFISLNDKRLIFQEELKQHNKYKKELNNAQEQLNSLANTLQLGRKHLTQKIEEVPKNLRKQLEHLETSIENLRKGPSAYPTPPITLSPSYTQEIPSYSQQPPSLTDMNLQFQQKPTVQDFRPANIYLEVLSENEMTTLKKANTQEKAFNDLIKKIVNKLIIPPIFEELNQIKSESMEKPFEEKKKQLMSTLKSQNKVLEKYEVSISDIEKVINNVHMDLQALRIRAPEDDSWWTIFSEKEGTARNMILNVDDSVENFKDKLGIPRKDLESANIKLAELISVGNDHLAKINGQIDKVKKNVDEIQSFLQKKIMVPFPLGVEDAILYYPLFLAAVYIYFVWRYIMLLQRAQELIMAYRKLGLSIEVIQIYFADFLGIKKVSGRQKTCGALLILKAHIIILWAVPGVFGILSAHMILTKNSLREAAPLILYVIAGALFITSYISLVICFLTTNKNLSFQS